MVSWKILNLKPSKIFICISVSKWKWVSRVDKYASETAADRMIWEVSARKSADIHESSQLIHYYLYFEGKWMWGLRPPDQRGAKELKRNTGQWLWCPILIPEAAVEAVGGQYRVCYPRVKLFRIEIVCVWR